MENEDERQLSRLLREWQAPATPPSLERRLFPSRRHWWSFLWTASIRVPVPVGIAVAAVIVVLAVFSARDRRGPATPARPATVDLRDFKPVDQAQVRIIRGGYVPK